MEPDLQLELCINLYVSTEDSFPPQTAMNGFHSTISKTPASHRKSCKWTEEPVSHSLRMPSTPTSTTPNATNEEAIEPTLLVRRSNITLKKSTPLLFPFINDTRRFHHIVEELPHLIEDKDGLAHDNNAPHPLNSHGFSLRARPCWLMYQIAISTTSMIKVHVPTSHDAHLIFNLQKQHHRHCIPRDNCVAFHFG